MDSPKSLARFSGFVLNLDACTLARDSGELIALTRGEFALLCHLVCRPGRAVSRETLLAATANRRFEPFDRSIDTLVGRLRRKIEPDPRQPRLIVTVPGKGYRFDGLTPPFGAPPTVDAGAAGEPPDPLSALPPPSDGPPRVMVLPFANLTADAGNDHLGRALAFEVMALLSAYPRVRVAPTPASAGSPMEDAAQAGRSAGARYVVAGGVDRLGDALRVIVTLSDSEARATIWSQVFDSAGSHELEFRRDIPRRIYDSVAGIRGVIQSNEERFSWRKAGASLSEYDYYLRGQSLYLGFTLPDVLRARAVFQEGLSRYPDSSLLRMELAWTYVWTAMARTNQDPGPDIDEAWRFANETLSAPSLSPLETWLRHWLMAFLYQWRDNDFSRSVAEARKAVELAPYDAFSRNDLSSIMAKAGFANEAVAWARSGLEHDPSGPSRYRANLASAHSAAGRDQEGVDALRDKSAEFPILSAALYARLGEVDKATALVAPYVQAGGGDSVHREDAVPLIEPTGTE